MVLSLDRNHLNYKKLPTSIIFFKEHDRLSGCRDFTFLQLIEKNMQQLSIADFFASNTKSQYGHIIV